MRGNAPPLPNVYGVGFQYRDKLVLFTSPILIVPSICVSPK